MLVVENVCTKPDAISLAKLFSIAQSKKSQEFQDRSGILKGEVNHWKPNQLSY